MVCARGGYAGVTGSACSSAAWTGSATPWRTAPRRRPVASRYPCRRSWPRRSCASCWRTAARWGWCPGRTRSRRPSTCGRSRWTRSTAATRHRTRPPSARTTWRRSSTPPARPAGPRAWRPPTATSPGGTNAHRAGTVFVVPSMAIDLLNSGAHRRHDLSGVLLLSSSAAALPPAVAAALAEAFPDATLVNYYTSTEAAPAETTMVLDPTRPGSEGRPTNPGDLAVLDEAGDPVPAGAVGEVWLRSPTAPRAYHGDPDGSAATFRRGWVRMGDLGHLDEEGYLFLVDRDGDVITSGGLKVSTLQVEAALYEHPAVAEAAVLGVPHPVLGSAVAAAVVPRAE